MRAIRRYHLARMKAKARRIYRDDPNAHTLANHLAHCSSDCCCNLRKIKGPTIGERRSVETDVVRWPNNPKSKLVRHHRANAKCIAAWIREYHSDWTPRDIHEYLCSLSWVDHKLVHAQLRGLDPEVRLFATLFTLAVMYA